MQPEEYDKLHRVEREHWFYSGKRAIVRHWLHATFPLRPDSLLLDCGAGTGLFAEEMAAHCRVVATDDHDAALQLLRQRLGPERVITASCDALPLPDNAIDCLTALDVLEHVADDASAVREFARVLKPGGVAIITVPAMQSLWSDWDTALHHFRRYDREGLRRLLDTSFRILHLNYINVLALPAIWLTRKLRLLGARRTNGARLEEFIPPAPINLLLRKSFVSLACQQQVQFPCGVGLLAVIRNER